MTPSHWTFLSFICVCPSKTRSHWWRWVRGKIQSIFLKKNTAGALLIHIRRKEASKFLQRWYYIKEGKLTQTTKQQRNGGDKYGAIQLQLRIMQSTGEGDFDAPVPVLWLCQILLANSWPACSRLGNGKTPFRSFITSGIVCNLLHGDPNLAFMVETVKLVFKQTFALLLHRAKRNYFPLIEEWMSHL